VERCQARRLVPAAPGLLEDAKEVLAEDLSNILVVRAAAEQAEPVTGT
jgi:hypothetical protein